MRNGGVLQPSTRFWLERAIDAYLAGDAASLDEALGVSRADKAALVLELRDSLLVEASTHLEAKSAHERAQKLSRAIQRLEAKWPQLKNARTLPRMQRFDELLLQARRLSNLPKTPRHLVSIFRKSEGTSFPKIGDFS